jgi:organic radical activating enzyme
MNKYLTVKRIEFLVTYLCSGKCRHCYAPKQKEGFPEHIDNSLAVDIVRKVSTSYDVDSVMTFGGEPLLFPELVCSIHKMAFESGIPSREVITNGYWSNDVKKIKRIAKNIAESGVNDIHVSVDAFHQEHIPLNIVRKTVESCLEAGVENIVWNPCWVISEDDDNRYNRITKSILKELEDLHIRVSKGNILEPDGLALINLKEFLPKRQKMPVGKCGDKPYTEPLDYVTSISVEPDGAIAVCNDFHIGNASETDIIDLLKNYDPYKISEMNAIIENGMRGLLDWAKEKGVTSDPDGYYSICHMCTDLRKRATP